MNIAIIFTYDVSLQDWKELGILNREIAIYKKLSDEHDISFTFVTYGNDLDLKILNHKNFKVVPIYSYIPRYKNKFIRLIYSFLIPLKIQNYLKNIEIIKTNQLNGSWVALILSRLLKVPIITRTGYDILTFSIAENKNVLRRIFYYIQTYLSLRFSKIYIVSSNTDKKYLSKLFKRYSGKISVRRNWVSIPNQNFNKKRINNLISVGRLERQKNFDYLIKQLKNTQFSLDIVGDGSLKSKLQKSASGNRNINFHGKLDHDLLLDLLSEYSIYVSASELEGSPKSILEAMSLGCIVFTPYSSNIGEIIQHNFNGIIYKKESTDLITELNNLIDNELKIKKLRENSIKWITENCEIGVLSKLEFEDYSLVLK